MDFSSQNLMKLTVLVQKTFQSILAPIPMISGTILSSMTPRVRERETKRHERERETRETQEREIEERESEREEKKRETEERESYTYVTLILTGGHK